MRRIAKSLKVFLVASGALAGIVLLGVLAVLAFVDFDAMKPRVEAAASSALGMEVTVEGPLRFGFFPGVHVAAGKVRVRNRGSELALVERADLSVELLPLFRKELRYGDIALNGARLSVERGRDGRYNFEKPPGVGAPFRGLELERVSFTDLVVAYRDNASDSGFESGKCKGELTAMRHPGGAPFLARLSLAGRIACDGLRGKQSVVSDLDISLEARDGVFDFKPVTLRAFGGKGSGSLRMDRSGEVPVLHLVYALSKFRVEELKGLPPGKTVSGVMDFSTTLSMRGRNRVELGRSAAGEVSLSGANLTLAGVDLDGQLARYASSQNFSLFDLGAFLVAGPLGLLVTKGYEFGTLAGEPGGSTPIRVVVSRWKVEKGVARAVDVAMATGANRLALQGGLDFVDDEFDEVYFALVDANGCATVRQRIRGPFGKPVLEKPSVLASLAGPVANLLGKAGEFLSGQGTKCEKFYAGSVPAPK